MTMEEKIVALMEKAKEDIQSRMEAENINASGRSSASWRVVRYASGVRIVYGGTDTAPLETLEIGRPGGPVPKGFTDILVQWSRDKGIPFDSEGKRRSFAYLLGRRIQREGTLRNMAHVDVYTSIVMDVAEKVKDGLRSVFTMQIHETIRAK